MGPRPSGRLPGTMPTLTQELVVTALAVAGPVASGWLWREHRRGPAVAVFVVAAAVAGTLLVRWGITPG